MDTRLIPILLATLLALTACYPAVDKGFGGGGSALSDSANTHLGEGKLSSSHPGWEEACCADCHQPDAHTQGLLSHECVDCHGANGAPPRHTNETPCAECHGREHRCGEFPDPESCLACHAAGGGGGHDDDDDDDERDDD
jgi:hypothetical protein